MNVKPVDSFWSSVNKVFLDLDGTLLDKYFDDYFWEEYVPVIYSKANNVSHANARQKLLSTYKRVESTLQWTDLDYWSEQLELDIPQLKKDISHLVKMRPSVIEFLEYMQNLGKDIYLVTNAHPTTLSIKMECVDLTPFFLRKICSKDVGAAKEQPEFWHRLQDLLPFDRETTLFIDDTANVLDSAHGYGLTKLVHIAKPSSRLPSQYSEDYLSIDHFHELMP